MFSLYSPSAQVYRRGINSFNPQKIKPDQCPENIDNTINSTKLMQMDPVIPSPVDLSLSLKKPLENCQAFLLYFFGKGRIINNSFNVFPFLKLMIINLNCPAQ